MEAYVNMQLQNNDQADTGSDSYVQMKMDEDKYLLMEPETSVRIEATGDDVNSKTKIVLTKGAIVNRIENKLNANSSYEIETPNSTMAVRGTTFRVALSEPDENGDVITTLEVHDGSVECIINEKNADGTITQKKVTVPAGNSVSVFGVVQDAEFMGGMQEFTMNGYDNPVLNFIGYMEDESETEEETISTEEETSSEEETTTEEESGTVIETEPETVLVEETTSTEEQSSANEPASSSQEESSSSDSGNDTPEPTTETPNQPTSYTVTFTYNGTTFATQTVKANATASVPLLCPAASGSWNFDFSTPITANTTIEWVAS